MEEFMKKLALFILLFIVLSLQACSSKSYTITYIDEDQIVHTQKVLFDTEVTPFNLDEKTGHSLLGWVLHQNDEETFSFPKTHNKDVTVYSKWQKLQYSVTFLDDDGTVLSDQVYDYNDVIIAPANPTKPKSNNKIYTFDKWDIPFDRAIENTIISAVYQESFEYSVIYYNENGLQFEVQTLIEGEKATYLDFSIDEDIKYIYEFKGWSIHEETEEFFDFNTPITTTIRLYPVIEKTRKIIDFEGMKVSFLGDSISTFYSSNSQVNSYYSGTNEFYYPIYSSTVKTVEQTWWSLLIKNANLNLGINNSWSGSSLYNYGSPTNSGAMNSHRLETLDENGTPDIIIVHIGTNDNVNGFSDSIFTASYDTLMKRLKTMYPDALIFCFTMGYSAYTGYNYTEERRISYNEIIRNTAKKYDQFVIDLETVQTVSNYSQMLGDSLHPNSTGMAQYAQTAYEALLRELKLQ